MSFSAFDHHCMAQALQEARQGMFTTDPNPRVGCVITRDETILAKGWHHAAGEAHAEIQALRAAGGDVNGATVYVTLEPCAHKGRTAPCVDALINAGVAQVVMASLDPNPNVNGLGKSRLVAHGVQCRVGLMADEARDLNPGFMSRWLRGRPWVRLKVAQSLDGRSALKNGQSQWITGPAARRDTQRWRARASVIMTGVGTVIDDDPSLNVRLEEGESRQPVRLILDSNWRTPHDAKTLGLPGQIIIAGLESRPVPGALKDSGVELLPMPESHGKVSLEPLLSVLAEREVNEVHVEAGAILSGALLEQGLVDEVLLYQAPCMLGSDARPGMITGELQSMKQRYEFSLLDHRFVGADLRMRLKPQYKQG